MNRYKTRKLITYILLIGYVWFLVNTLVLSGTASVLEGSGFTLFHLYDELMGEDNRSVNLYIILLKIALMIPFGILFPTARQKRCLTQTLTCGSLMGFTCEMLQYQYKNGMTCFDDVIFAVIGTYIGYRLFLWLCTKVSDGFRYLRTPENPKRGNLIFCMILLFTLFYVVHYAKNEGLSPVSDEERFVKSVTSYEDIIYQTYYNDLSAYKTSVTFFNPITNQDILTEQYARVVLEHPELFWLTGGGSLQGATLGGATTYRFYPDIQGDIKDIPEMAKRLDACVDSLVSSANQQYTDYDKARLIHDAIIINCNYDFNTYYSIITTNNVSKSDFGATAYGCLLNHKAVCAGYAKAYQLVMNRLGIECGFVSGCATNSEGQTGDHAWNYIKLDDGYYFVDLTWDDPVSIGDTTSNLRWDYFCLTSEELMKNHAIDEGQNVPLCEGSKY